MAKRHIHVLYHLAYGTLGVFAWCWRQLPANVARQLARLLGLIAYVALFSLRRKAFLHVKIAFPTATLHEQRQLVRKMFQHLCESVVELLHSERFFATGQISIPQQAVLDQALEEGKGVVLVTGHIGNWELMGVWVRQLGYNLTAVARRIKIPQLDRWMRAWRQQFGIETIVREQPGALKHILQALRQKKILAVLIDQDTDVDSVWVPFFGRQAKTPTAAARLAKQGIPLIVASGHRVAPWHHRIDLTRLHFSAQDSIETMTATITATLEEHLLRSPEQWVWFHQRWRSPVPPLAK